MSNQISIRINWEESPGVKPRLHAKTWCSLTIDISNICITKVESTLSGSIRNHVYGSALPLFEWFLDNWWFIFGETWKPACPIDRIDVSGRIIASRNQSYASWIRRHDILAARQGGSLPDLIFCFDGDSILAKWSSDPTEASQASSRPVRFLSQGIARLDPDQFLNEISRFMTSVIDRISQEEDPEACQAIEQWQAIQNCTQSEKKDYLSIASLGIDPFDPGDSVDQLLERIQQYRSSLGSTLSQDLLDATTVDALDQDKLFIDSALGQLYLVAPRDLEASIPSMHSWEGLAAHEAGYQRAEQIRERLGLRSFITENDLKHAFRMFAKQDATIGDIENPAQADSQNIEAVVGMAHGDPIVFAKPLPRASNRKFRLGRCLYQFAFGDANESPRLVTKSRSWEQRASRAFAAELLAPKEELRKLFQSETDLEEIEEAANEYEISSRVIAFQIENHKLSIIAQL
jgi:hypothetical protein